MTPGPKKEPKNDPDSLRSGAEKKLGRKPKDTPAIAGTTPEQQQRSKEPTISFEDYAYGENRYRVLQKTNPAGAAILMKKATAWTANRFEYYQKLAELTYEKK